MLRGAEIDGQALHPGDKDGDRSRATVGDIDVNTVTVECGGDWLAELLVNDVGDLACRGEVGVEQQQRDDAKAAQVDGCFTFDDSPLGDSADGRMIDGSYVAARPLRVTPDD